MHTYTKLSSFNILKMTQKQITRNDLNEEIMIPEGISAILEENVVTMKKDSEEIVRKINPMINVKVEGDKIILETKKATKKQKKVFGTLKAHLNNMINGLTEKFKYKLQISNVHFPMTVKVNETKNEMAINNFLGEKTDRIIKLVPGVSIKVDKEFIEIEDCDIEKAGQCAANIEKGAKPKNKDRRIFQDGIYIIEKPGRKFL